MQTEIVSINRADRSESVVGEFLRVVLQRGNEYVACEGVLDFDDTELDNTFEEWQFLAGVEAEGFETWMKQAA